MVQKRRTIDGFYYYHSAAQSEPPRVPRGTAPQSMASVAIDDGAVTQQDTGVPTPWQEELMGPIDGLDANAELTLKKRGRVKGAKKLKSLRRRIFGWMALLIVVVILGTLGFVGYRLFAATGKVFKGNALSILLAPETPLKTDQYGNSNILLLGTSESDPNHPGAELTDSMMVASINRQTHRVFLLSVPRDLWVTYAKPCVAGYSGKINAVYECALGSNLGGLSTTQNDEATAENLTAEKVGSVTGINIQYVVHMNLAVIQKVVDAVGGIDITINSPDPRGILDRNFDWRCNYKCYLVKYPNGPVHLTGTDAMWLAQARNDSGGYGLPRGNFDREENQRKIIMATKDKATSIGFLANPLNVINLLDAMGANLHTNIDTSEVKTFVTAIKEISNQNITSIDIMTDNPNILTTGTGPDGSSIVRPIAGLEDYSGLQAFTKQLLKGNAPAIGEAASVDVLNGSGAPGAAAQVGDTLSGVGIVVNREANTIPGNYPHYTIYDISGGKKPNTLALLKSTLSGASVQTNLPAGVTSTASFVVIVGPVTQASSASGTSAG